MRKEEQKNEGYLERVVWESKAREPILVTTPRDPGHSRSPGEIDASCLLSSWTTDTFTVDGENSPLNGYNERGRIAFNGSCE